MKKPLRIVLISTGITFLVSSIVIYIWRMNMRAGRPISTLMMDDPQAYELWGKSRWPVYIMAGLGLTLLWLVFGGVLDKMIAANKKSETDS